MSAKSKPGRNRDLGLFDLEETNTAAPGQTLAQDEDLFRSILSNILDSVLILDWDGSILFANRAAYALVGMEEDANIVGLNAAGFIHPDDIHLVLKDLQLVKDDCGGFLAEYRIKSATGQFRWVEGLGKKINIKGRPLDIVILRNITERKEAQKMLLSSEMKFRTLAETTPAAIFIYKGDTIVYSNPGMEMLTGYTHEELMNMRVWDLVHPEARDLAREIAAARQEGSIPPSRYELKIITRQGEDKWVDLSAGSIELDGQYAAMGTAHDITDRKKAEEIISRLAYYDPLTGLPNRLLFNDRLNMAITRAERFQDKIAVFMLDLDKFKDVNDTLGHTMGDSLLKAVADRLGVSLRKSDTVARMGGDEFIICIADLKEHGNPVQVAEKILENFIEPFTFNSHTISIKSSLGMAIYPEDGTDGEMLIRNADIAMYRAKHSGGNLFRSYSE
jgi:diguanylate cyclase (GGDEF)-like protein/PAS domain S-box-containing protein